MVTLGIEDPKWSSMTISSGDLQGPPDATEEELAVLREIFELKEREKDIRGHIRQFEETTSLRRAPLDDQLGAVQLDIFRLQRRWELLRAGRSDEGPPPGPRSLRWVEGLPYSCACMAVIIANVTVMFFELQDTELAKKFWLLDQIFLVWYVVELVLKMLLFRRTYLCGSLTSDRVFHWLDFLIVIGGIVDQWALPLLSLAGFLNHRGHGSIGLGALRGLRILRITRMLRMCKALYLFLHMDLAWTDGRNFEAVTTTVIVINSITMGVELDVPWEGWQWVDIVFLAFYTFELLVKMKRHRENYFTHEKMYIWHTMDFIIVVSGLIEMLGEPAFRTAKYYLTGHEDKQPQQSILSVVRILRLLRVLRLYRLLTFSKSLRKLVSGIADAMHGTVWVIVLTFVILYIFSIIFTTLVGQGLVFGSSAPPEAEDTFGSVEQSLFMLFKLMNDDQSVVYELTESIWVRLLFMVSMVVLNWIMLATLTSVVTDHMNSSTSRQEKAEEEEMQQLQRRIRLNRLRHVFQELDKDQNGLVEEGEFEEMLMHTYVRNELLESTGLKGHDLAELFEYLCHETDDHKKVINYEDFIEKLTAQGKTATERAIYRLEAQIRQVELRNDQRFDHLARILAMPVEQRPQSKIKVKLPGPAGPTWKDLANRLDLQEQQERILRVKTGVLLNNDLDSWLLEDEDEPLFAGQPASNPRANSSSPSHIDRD